MCSSSGFVNFLKCLHFIYIYILFDPSPSDILKAIMCICVELLTASPCDCTGKSYDFFFLFEIINLIL